jgi:hypothetical protein
LRYRITNDKKRPHVIYDTAGRARLVLPEKHVDMDLSDGAAEYVWERAIAGVGPRIERLGGQPKASEGFQERVETVEVAAIEPEPEPEPKRKKAKARAPRKQQQPAEQVW